MNTEPLNEIPAYQSIDIMLGRNQNVEILPVKGWVILCATHGATIVAGEEKPGIVCEQSTSKSPCKWELGFHKAWVHSQESIHGKISNRKHWSLR